MKKKRWLSQVGTTRPITYGTFSSSSRKYHIMPTTGWVCVQINRIRLPAVTSSLTDSQLLLLHRGQTAAAPGVVLKWKMLLLSLKPKSWQVRLEGDVLKSDRQKVAAVVTLAFPLADSSFNKRGWRKVWLCWRNKPLTLTSWHEECLIHNILIGSPEHCGLSAPSGH